MAERVVLPQVTVDALQWEKCDTCYGDPWVCRRAGRTAAECRPRPKWNGQRLVADQWVPLPEPLTVECPTCQGTMVGGNFQCDGTGRIPLAEGIYDIGAKYREPQPTEGPDYHADHAAWERAPVVPLAEGVRLRQVGLERVVRLSPNYPAGGNIDYTPEGHLYLDGDLYDRLVSSVDGGPPWGVLNIRREP